MKTLALSIEDLAQEILITYKGHNFMVSNAQGGQYGYERRVIIFVIKDNLERLKFKTVGILRLFSSSSSSSNGDEYVRTSKAEQCLVIGNTDFDFCLDEAKAYIKKYIDFISE